MKSIVITGGRNSGKTRAIGAVKTMLEKSGFLVFVVPSSVQHLKECGIDVELTLNQVLVTKHQLFMGGFVQDKVTAEKFSGDGRKIVTLFDGGLMDGKAYCKNHSAWLEALYGNSLSEEFLLANWYDMVIHMPNCCPKASEAYQDHKVVGDKLREVWEKHRKNRYLRRATTENQWYRIYDLVCAEFD
jgi:hypothetical protein